MCKCDYEKEAEKLKKEIKNLKKERDQYKELNRQYKILLDNEQMLNSALKERLKDTRHQEIQ